MRSCSSQRLKEVRAVGVDRFSRATAACALRLASDALLDAAALDVPPPVLAAASLRLASLVTEDGGGPAASGKWWYACDARYPRLVPRLAARLLTWVSGRSDEDVAGVASILQRVHAA